MQLKVLKGKKVDLDKAAEELGVDKESLTKENRPLLEEWMAKVKPKK